MKKYEFVEFRGYSGYGWHNQELFSSFQNLAEKGFHYSGYLPGRPEINHGDIASLILIFEKDVEDESDKDF